MHCTYPQFSFSYTPAGIQRARIGKLTTPHGSISTPNFIFCGTKASIKSLSTTQVKEAKADIILANTYHLMLQPGADLIAQQGGLHRFMCWDGPLFTDSGGYQVFSMGYGSVAHEIKGKRGILEKKVVSITEEGVQFFSYVNGSRVFLSPEESIKIQQKLGADLIVQFDECTPFHVDKHYTETAMQRSLRWGKRSLEQMNTRPDLLQAMYGVIQGGVYLEHREESIARINDMPFFGTAIGGSLGSEKQQMYDITSHCITYADPQRPIHLLGIGGIADIFACVRAGVDTFDCVHPTRIARHGIAIMPFASGGDINLHNAAHRNDTEPLDAESHLWVSNHYSRSYLHHLIKAKELLALQVLTQHNIAQMGRLMRGIREALQKKSLKEYEYFWLGDTTENVRKKI